MTDKQPHASSQPAPENPAEPPILRDVVEPLKPRAVDNNSREKPAQSPGDQQRDERPEELLDKYDLSLVDEEREERRRSMRR
ncbi:hypothetical protein [Phytopseudomonas punonensis]|uniref:Uncharacterized protein n=1 Tax=Phytopseudomonas punonensis TaxID=1220495 RepID=A0A1M7P2Z9_9GAMM|nr:hypothetical protein [Pseudomonas punonensis]SHN10820.1 hypothetical protein SAMN05216288_0607 [Pseudomonas punonensis]